MANKMRSKNPPEKKTSLATPVSKGPPDGGWGWFVVFGSFMIHVVSKYNNFTCVCVCPMFFSLAVITSAYAKSEAFGF